MHGRHRHPLSAFGRPLRAPFTFATFHHERTLALVNSLQQMTDIYDYDRIRPTTAVYGVVGDPIAIA